jgi:sigma-B regulation protein RsbU (phosphoserine phosphatase)
MPDAWRSQGATPFGASVGWRPRNFSIIEVYFSVGLFNEQANAGEDKNVGGQSILIVDDEPKILEAIDRELHFWKTQKRVTLYTALSAQSALDILKENHESIQVVVSDLKMSAMGGDELICETKRLYPDIRSILITGYSEVGGIGRAVSAGITAFIQKPWETDSFIREIEKAMSQYYSDVINRDYLSRLVSQMERTGQVQKRLFHHDDFPSARFSVTVAYQPLTEFFCGGDFYQVIPLSEDRCIIILGDVSGHGLEAAFVTGIIRTLISREELGSIENSVFSPGAFLAKLNRLVLRELAKTPEFIITLTAAYLDLSENRMVFSNAGNLPIYHVRPDECTTHAVPGYPCGFTPDAKFVELAVPLRRGDKIVFMTDGLVERGRIAGYVNLEAVRSLLMHFCGDPEFNRKMVGVILEMFPDRKFYDDATMVSVDIL